MVKIFVRDKDVVRKLFYIPGMYSWRVWRVTIPCEWIFGLASTRMVVYMVGTSD
jgi:hypothetical protein